MTPQPTLLPFDLAKALAGATVVTRDGHVVTELTVDKQQWPVRGVVDLLVRRWTKRGFYYVDGEPYKLDLFLSPELTAPRDPNSDDELKAAREHIAELDTENRRLKGELTRARHGRNEWRDKATTAETHAKALGGRVKELEHRTVWLCFRKKDNHWDGEIHSYQVTCNEQWECKGFPVPALLRPATAGPEVQP
jgi:hypothetical protein